MANNSDLKKTPLYSIHKELGGKLVPFAGWHMPIHFQGVVQEHKCVRDGVGIFDVSHMGEIEITGPDAKKLIQYLVTNDIETMKNNQALYTLMCLETGGVVDDLLVYRFSENHYFLCVNASNSDKDFQWILANAKNFNVSLQNTSQQTAQVAVQGKYSEELLQKICDISLNEIEYYHFRKAKIHKFECIVARTGYTGEDGFEVYINCQYADLAYKAILEAGKSFDLQPIGLGARDTLRMEMGYALYGNELHENCNPLEAGLGWVIKLKKNKFLGQAALKKQKDAGLSRKLVGLHMLDRGVPRSHYRVLSEGTPVGQLTSGTFSPSLNTGIGLCYVSTEYAKLGTKLDVEIRKLNVPAKVVKPPFLPSRVKKN